MISTATSYKLTQGNFNLTLMKNLLLTLYDNRITTVTGYIPREVINKNSHEFIDQNEKPIVEMALQKCTLLKC